MNEQVIFSYFRSQFAEDYKRLAIVAVVTELQSLEKPIGESALKHAVRKKHQIDMETIEDVLSVLRSASGFNALASWKGTRATLCRLRTESQRLDQWMHANAPLVHGVRQHLAA